MKEVRPRVADHLIAGARERSQTDLVAHRPGGHEETGLFPQQIGRVLLQAVDGRVITEHVVTDFCLGHRATHLGRGARDRVGTQIYRSTVHVPRIAGPRLAPKQARSARFVSKR
jgi:hypothetical protein